MSKMKSESVLDLPQQDLDSGVWIKDDNGSYSLTEEAVRKIDNVIRFMTSDSVQLPLSVKLNSFGVNITGSITSNQYTEDSDIDLHFNSTDVSQEQLEAFQKEFRAKFEGFKSVENEESWHINGHPIEVYFQGNVLQDYMSVGCYDYLNRKWLVGPELKPLDYDPYQDLYNQDMRHINSIIGDIRNVIMECFETAIAIRNSNDEEFREYEYNHLKDRIIKAAMIFKNAQEYRKVYSSPTSIEQAKMFRNSRKWKIADSSFKLMDKFGYLRILRTLTQCQEKMQENKDISRDTIVSTVIDVIKDNFSTNKNLNETELEEYREISEGLMKNISKFAILAGLLSVPGLTDNQVLADELSKIPQKEFNINSPSVSKAISKASKNDEVINGLSKSHLVNILATIIYNEAMIDYKKTKDKRCLIAIGNVINNRAGGKKEKMAEVVTKPNQFYSAKHIRGGIKDSDFVEYYPVGGYKECWELCKKYALQLVNGNLTDVIGNRNMIANEKLDNKASFDSWGKNADLKIGSHTFGYEKSQDGFRDNRKNTIEKTYTVKKGDTFSKIAKDNNMSIEQLSKKNPDIKDLNKLSVGQSLKI